MNYVYYATDYDSLSLAHHGVKGQKWGVRRYQNEDGSWTDAGLKRRKALNSVAAIAGGIGVSVGTTIGTGNPLAGRIAGGLTAGVIKRSLDARAENKGRKKSTNNDDDDELSETYKEDLKRNSAHWKQNADGYRKDQMDNLSNMVKYSKGDGVDLKKEFGTKTDKETMKYVMDAVKGLNETDYDMVLFQYMDNDMQIAFEKGILDTQTFKKYYDATAAEYGADMIGSGDYDTLRDWHDSYNKHCKGKTDEERLSVLFDRQNEITHYFYSSDSAYL